jgi:hypothetical protein
VSQGQNGEVHGKRLPDGSYELRMFVGGCPVTHAFIHIQGTSLFKDRSLFANWIELLFVEERPDETLVYPVADIEGFIDAVGMKRIDSNPDKS